MEYLENYIYYLESVKNRSKLTVFEYERDIRDFLNYMSKKKKKNITATFIKSMTKQDGRAYLVYCDRELHNSANTRARKVSSIRGFYTYLFDEEGVDCSIRRLEKPKTEQTLPKYLTTEECRELLRVSNEGECAERDSCIITLFLNCGMRLSELLNIKVEDIKANNTIVIYGKGSKERTVYLNECCLNAIDRYMKVRRSGDDYLFVNIHGEHMSRNRVQQMVKSNLEKIGRGDCSTHKLRHSCATMYYEQGADILTLKELLGHESVDTTQIYTHVKNSQLASMVSSSPLNSHDTPPAKPNIKVLAS